MHRFTFSEANIFWFKNHHSRKFHSKTKTKCDTVFIVTSWQSCRNLWSSHWSLSLWSHCWACSRFWFPLWDVYRHRNNQKLVSYLWLNSNKLLINFLWQCFIAESLFKTEGHNRFHTQMRFEIQFHAPHWDCIQISDRGFTASFFVMPLWKKHLKFSVPIGAAACSVPQWNGG